MSILPKALTVPARSLLSRWFAARAPKSDNATLNLRNVYIFFSREGKSQPEFGALIHW